MTRKILTKEEFFSRFIEDRVCFSFVYSEGEAVGLVEWDEDSTYSLNTIIGERRIMNGVGRPFICSFGAIRRMSHVNYQTEEILRRINEMTEDMSKLTSPIGDSLYHLWQAIELEGTYYSSIQEVMNRYFFCDGCSRLTSQDDAVDGPGGSLICPRCEEDTFVCENCGETCWNDNYGADGLCRDCCHEEGYDDDDDNDRCGSIHDYGFKPSPNFTPTYNPKKLYMGIELELECNRNSDPSDVAEVFMEDMAIEESSDFYLKYDGSLSHGFEIVTHPRTLQAWKGYSKLKDCCDYLQKKGCKSHNTSTCGLHVHFNRSALSQTEQIKMSLFFWNNFDKVEKFSRRVENTYCHKKDYAWKANRANYSMDRHEAINWTNNITPEFRIFRGTLNYDTIIATLEFVDCLCKFSKTASTVKFAKGDITWNDFLEYGKKSGCTKMMEYMDKRGLSGDFKQKEGEGECA